MFCLFPDRSPSTQLFSASGRSRSVAGLDAAAHSLSLLTHAGTPENGERRSEKIRFIGIAAQSIFFMRTY